MSHTPLDPLPQEPRPGQYRHYKGQRYRVLGIARHTETREVVVYYQALYGEFGFWVRPHAMFTANVTLADGTTTPRFAYLDP
jgi:hypothetical protein